MKQFLFGLAVMVGLAGETVMAATYNGYETPDYRVVSVLEGVEIRYYPPYTIARVTRPGARSQAVGSGFRALAGYIFGRNKSGEKLKMTAPVTQTRAGSDWSISFVLPRGVNPSTAPEPVSEDISVSTEMGGRFAVITFSGLWTDARLKAHEDKLLQTLREDGLHISGPPIYMFYNDPTTLPWNRRNEIAFRLVDQSGT
ncbi:MAG: heme-binding protein [Pseudomonadota bacterium]